MSPVRLIALLFAAVLLGSPVAPAFAQDAPAQHTTANLSAVATLRCDALRRGKVATQQADIYRTEASHASGVARIQAEQRVTDAEATASAAFEEAGRLKRRLKGMVDGYVSARQLEWYQTVDQAKKIKLEDKIKFARELMEEGCS